MSKQVDERILKMEFDNKQFESNVKTSMNTLDKLNNSLNMKGASKGLETIGTAAKNIDMSGLSNSIDAISVKFSALQVMGVTALTNITNAAINAGKKLYGATIGQIQAGGKQRALNIEQAKFQLEGLGVAWNSIKDDINYGVKDTAYGLDAAAKVASQLVASEVKVGDEMKTALRGISGVAAMTSSEYEDIGRIFTTIAGQGKVTTQQLNQIAIRGLNAAATIGKFLGKTEADVREMVHDGEIDFATFAAAMDSAFGEHAKDANKTFSGAMSNVRAALSRIGADFYTLKHEDLRDVFNALIPVIDNVHTKVKPLIDDIGKVMRVVADNIINKLNNINLDWIPHIISSIENVFNGLLSILKPVKEAFLEVFPPATAEQITSFAEKIKDLTSHFKITEETAAKLKTVFTTVFTVIKSVINVAKTIVSLITSILTKAAPVSDVVLNIANTISGGIDKIMTSFSPLEALSTIISKLFDGISYAFSNAVPIITTVAGKIGGVLKKLISGIRDMLGGGSGSEVNKLINSSLFILILTKLKDVVGSLKSGLGELNPISQIGKSISGVLNSVKDSLTEWQNSLKSDSLLKIAGAIGILTASLVVLSSINPDKLSTALVAITAIFGELMGAMAIFEKIASRSKNALKGSGALIAMSVSVLILAKALKTLSSLSWGELATGLAGIMGIMTILAAYQAAMSKIKPAKMMSSSFALIAIGAAMEIFADVCAKLGKLQWNELAGAGTAISGILLMFVGFQELMKLINPKKMLTSAASMVIIGAAMEIFADVCSKFKDIEWVDLGKTGAAIGGMLAIFAGFQELIKLINPKKMLTSATSLIIIGAAMEIFADVCSKFKDIKWSDLGKAGAAIGGILALASGFMLLSGMANKMLASTTALVIIGAAMEIFADVCSKFKNLEWGDLGKAGAAIGGILALASGFMLLSSMASNMLMSSAALVIIGAAMEIFADVCSKFATLEWEQLGKAGAAIGGLLVLCTGFAIVAGLAQGILISSAALLIMATALKILTPVITELGAMSWEGIAKGLVAIAGAFAVIGVAGLVLSPLIPEILALSAAIALLGVGCLAAGAGMAAFAAGFAALAAAGASGAESFIEALKVTVEGALELIPIICEALIQNAPKIGEALKSMVLTSIDVLVECVPALANGALQLLVGVMEALVQYTPQLTELLMRFLIGLMDSAADKLPELLDSLTNFIVTLINGLADHVGEFIEAGVNLVGAIIQGIADALGPIVEKIIVPILGIFKDLIVELAPVLKDLFVEAAPELQGIAEAISSAISAICGTISTIVEQIAPIINSIIGLVQQLGNTISQIMQAIVNLLNAAGSAIVNILQSIGSVFDSVFNGISNVITSVGGTIKSVLDGISGIISSIGEAALNAGKGFESLANGVKTITELNLADMAASLGAVALGVGEITKKSKGLAEAGNGMKQISDSVNASSSAIYSMSAGIMTVTMSMSLLSSSAENAMAQVTAAVTQAVDSFNNLSVAEDVISNMSAAFTALGTSIIVSFVGGINSAQGQVVIAFAMMMAQIVSTINANRATVQAAFNGIIISAVTTIRGHYQSFYSAGGYLVQGFAAGISANTYMATARAKAMADAATQTAQAALKVNSPSKVFMSIGRSVGEGFAKGIGDKAQTSNVVNTTVGLANRVISSAKDALEINSPSRAFIAIGNYIGQGLAIGIRDSAKEAVAASKEMSDRIASVTQKSFEDIEKWVSDAKHFDELSLEEELGLWNALISKYGEGTEERLKAEKNAYTVYKELYEKRNSNRKAEFDNSKSWIDTEKEYNRLSLEEELAAWERIQARYAEGTDERKEADKQVYKLKHQLIDEDIHKLEAEIAKNKELLAILEEGSIAYNNLLKEIQHDNELLNKANYENSENWISKDEKLDRMGLADKLAANRRMQKYEGRTAEEREKLRLEEYEILKEINKKYEQMQKDAEDTVKEHNRQMKALEKEKADKITEIEEKLADDIDRLNEEYDSKLKSRTDALYRSYGLFDEVASKDKVKGSKLMKNLQDQVAEFEDWTDILGSLAGRGLNKALIEELQEMGPSAIEQLKGLNSLTDSQLAQWANLWSDKHKEATDKATAELSDFRKETDNEIEQLKTDAQEEIDEWVDYYAEAMAELKTETNNALAKLQEDFRNELYVVQEDWDAKFKGMGETGNKLLREAGWDETGEYIMEGLTQGIKRGTTDFLEAIKATMNLGEETAKETEEIHSPSKKFAQIGMYLIQGLIVGINSSKDKFLDATEVVGTDAIDMMRGIVGRVLEFANSDIDIQPTIRPVIDLSDVNSGISQMNGMLVADRSLSLGMSIGSSIQNGNEALVKEMTAKMEMSNAKLNDKFSEAMDGVRSDIAELVDEVSRLQVVLDGDTLVGAITPKMDRSLGVRATIKRRGSI